MTLKCVWLKCVTTASRAAGETEAALSGGVGGIDTKSLLKESRIPLKGHRISLKENRVPLKESRVPLKRNHLIDRRNPALYKTFYLL